MRVVIHDQRVEGNQYVVSYLDAGSSSQQRAAANVRAVANRYPRAGSFEHKRTFDVAVHADRKRTALRLTR